MVNNTGLESIKFQNSDLFDGITACLDNIRKKDNIKNKTFYSDGEIDELSKVIQKHTGIDFSFRDGNFGPAVYIPRLDQHIFDDANELKEYQEYMKNFDLHYDMRRTLNTLDSDLIAGSVSLKESKVTGFFTKIKCKMFLPRSYLKDTTLTNEELAAIILHEIGHVFTSFEYMDRSVTTNQSLSLMLRVMDRSVNFEDKKVIFRKAKDKLSLDDDSFKLIMGSNDKEFVTLVVMNQRIEDCKSELGASVYDVVSCEYLADQFAARHGAGRYLISGLDKILRRGMSPASSIYFFATLNSILTVTSALLMVPGFAGVIFGILTLIAVGISSMFTASKSDTEFIYDNNLTRLSRIKHQMIQRLKQTDAQEDEKKYILNYLDEVEPIIKKYSDDNSLKLRNRVAFFFSKKHKYDFEYMSLQKDLEQMGNSDLFVMSEKLKRI
jgi:hypothetical protein